MNTQTKILPDGKSDGQIDAVIKLAVLAVGGQGGGVLSNWIVALAEREGYAVQATSVAGVAQRTGATIYYIEMYPEGSKAPVFALAPAEGDVDILIAAELMEAGRAILRGFVTPDRTTLIASSHRALATMEKVVPGTGIADPAEVRKVAAQQAKHFLAFDMEEIAAQSGSVISASLFGALAGSRTLPFSVESYRETIRESGRGVNPSLAAFDAARARAEGAAPTETTPAPAPARKGVAGPKVLREEWASLVSRLDALPDAARGTADAGLRKTVDYLDLAYGQEYLKRLEEALAADMAAGGPAQGHAFTVAAAKAIANAMCYDDIPRVADLKTRAGRAARIAEDVRAGSDHVVQVTEFVHPGAAEAVSLLPARWGKAVLRRPWLYGAVDWAVNRGRRMRSDAILPFLSLYLVAGLRRHRRNLLRHESETAHLERLTEAAQSRVAENYSLGCAVWRIQRLVKGYSDTHARGLSKVARLYDGLHLVDGRSDAAAWMDRLIAAALKDPKGEALDGALDTIRSFAANSDAA